MRFHCAACGREMQAEEALSFCPFCGKPYQGEARAAQVVIAGDGERAVQEKYWEEASDAISFLTKYLKPEKKHVREEKGWPDNEQFVQELRKVRSNEAFMRVCENRLGEIKKRLGRPAKPEESPLDAETERERMRQALLEAARSLGCPNPEEMEPELLIKPTKLEIKIEPLPEFDAAELLAQAQAVLPRVRQVLGEEGAYPAIAAAEDVVGEDWTRVKPKALERQLRVLFEEEYDPLFGAPCGPFLQAFWKAVFLLHERIRADEMPDEPRETQFDVLMALSRYLDEWEDRLERALDEAYGRGEDMLRVSGELEALSRAAEKAKEAKEGREN